MGSSQTTEDGRPGAKPSLANLPGPDYLCPPPHPPPPLPAVSPPATLSPRSDLVTCGISHQVALDVPTLPATPHGCPLQLVNIPHQDVRPSTRLGPSSRRQHPLPGCWPQGYFTPDLGLIPPRIPLWRESKPSGRPPRSGHLGPEPWVSPRRQPGLAAPASQRPLMAPLHKLGRENYSPGWKGGEEGRTRDSGHLALMGLRADERVQDSRLASWGPGCS